MKKENIQAFIVPSSDPHQSEYVAEYWMCRAWISGFTGSAGTFACTMNEAGLWTDSRYFIQGEQQLRGTTIDLHKVYNQGSPLFIDWLSENLNQGDIVGCDGRLFSKKELDRYQKKLHEAGIEIDSTMDLVTELWKDRPNLPQDPIFELGLEYAGENRKSKIDRIRDKMKAFGVDQHLVTTLDDIAWIFNIRGKDIPFNPVAYSYALISYESCTLFIDPHKVPHELSAKFEVDGIKIKAYEDIWEALNTMNENSSILIDENYMSYALYRAINAKNKINKPLPTILMKSQKNEREIAGFRKAMIKDGVALTHFYIWLEQNVEKGPSEFEIGEKIAYFRSQQDGYQSESFNAIVGYKGNGAIVHYKAEKETAANIQKEGLLLIDSGGQYLEGTTDITRTISLGKITDDEKEAYTRVLKGNIELDRAKFPEGTLGIQLDTLARIHLWRNSMNYLHGTGHGVGHFLNVHEGPQGFHAGLASRSKHKIIEYSITTNEPGYYATDQFGIRIENCLLAKKVSDHEDSFLEFESLTLFPIETDLIKWELMNKSEIEWLNAYHQKVYESLSPYLNSEEKHWLKEKCKPV